QSSKLRIPTIDETSRANGSRWGGAQAYWADEAASVAASRPRFGSKELNTQKLLCTCYVTDELLADTAALGAWVQRFVSMELAFKAGLAIIRGTGAGQPVGILNSSATIVQTKTGGQSAGTFTRANALDMYSRQFDDAQGRAVWFVHKSIVPQLYSSDL